MTHRHRFRRGVAPRPSAKDVRLWDRLMKRADAVGRAGHGGVRPFAVAVEKARRAVMPVGHQQAGSVFDRLIKLGLGWGELSPEERRTRAPEVTTLVAECRAILATVVPSAPTEGRPAPRMRKPAGGRPFAARLPYRED